MKIIGDVGSCHLGRPELAHDAIDLGKDVGLDAVKFQLFPDSLVYTDCGNIALPYEWFPELVDHGTKAGIEVFASAFNQNAVDLINEHCNSIKFAYGSSDAYLKSMYEITCNNIYLSVKATEIWRGKSENEVWLWCIPEYPVPYQVDFTDIFKRYGFDGFSDHTMGYKQTLKAVKAGAAVIEKHFKPFENIGGCPDSVFALGPKELGKMMEVLNG